MYVVKHYLDGELHDITYPKGFSKEGINYAQIPNHLRHLTVEQLRNLFYLFRGKV